jgi:hypothetical protein
VTSYLFTIRNVIACSLQWETGLGRRVLGGYLPINGFTIWIDP